MNKKTEKILVLGATSAIAQEVVKLYAAQRTDIVLVGRDRDKLNHVAEDALARGAESTEIMVCDFANRDSLEALTEDLKKRPVPELVLVAWGVLPNQRDCEKSTMKTCDVIQTNFTNCVLVLNQIAEMLVAKRQGTIAVISSVAGDRGRQSNYLYGATKGGLSIYLQGLRNRLHKYNIQVVTVKPGFVDTPMTADIQKGFLWASPDVVAKGIVKAIVKRRDVVYLPGFWRWILLIIRLIPEFFFKRLSL